MNRTIPEGLAELAAKIQEQQARVDNLEALARVEPDKERREMKKRRALEARRELVTFETIREGYQLAVATIADREQLAPA